MKKTWIAWMCAALLLTGCADSGQNSSLPGEEPSNSISSSQETLSPTEDPQLDAMMAALSGYEQGTAGSSLKVVIAACGILNYAQQFDPSQGEQLKVNLEAYLQNADTAAVEAILAGREPVEAMANDILDNGVDGMKDLLESAGNPNQYDRYDRDQYEAVAKILNEVLDNYSDSL